MREIFLIPALIAAAVVFLGFRLLLLTLGSVVYVYLLPGVIAMKRNHPHQQQIYIVAAVAGWMILPWICILWYALRGISLDNLGTDTP